MQAHFYNKRRPWSFISGLMMVGLVAAGVLATPWAVAQPAQPAAASEGPVFVTTVPPLAMIVRELTAPRAQVSCLLEPGASPHTYAPRPSDARRAAQAVALVCVSPELDGWAAALESPARVQVLDMVPPALRRRLSAPHHHVSHEQERATTAHAAHERAQEEEARAHEEHEDSETPGGHAARQEHEHEGHEDHDGGDGEDLDMINPHFWLDPLAVEALAGPLAERLGELDPAGAELYRANARRFGEQLRELAGRLRAGLAPVKGQAVMQFHPSMDYLLARGGLRCVETIEPLPGREPSPRRLQELTLLARDQQVTMIFWEPQLPQREARVLAETTGLPLRRVDPLGQADLPYADYLMAQVKAIATPQEKE